MSDKEENKLQNVAQTPSSETEKSMEPTLKKNLEKTTIEKTKEIIVKKENSKLKVSGISEEKAKKSVNQDAVDEIEKHVAKKSENHHDTPEVPLEDYKSLDLKGIILTLENLVKEHPIQGIKKHADILKKFFNKKFGILVKEAKETFIKEGGNTIDFRYENPIQEQFNKVLSEYKKRSKEFRKQREKQYETNLLLKQNIIEELKTLIDEGDAKSMYKHFRELQTKWREVGPLDRAHYSDIWQTYHFHVERFYDLLHLRNDLRDLDFKHNLEEKLKLVEKAEELAQMEDVNKAFAELQILHRLWKEEIGPVSREYREEIWERFSNATKTIHDKRHLFFDNLNEQYKENILKKEAVIAEIAAYDASENKTHNDWQRSMKDIQKMRDLFFKIGQVPRSQNSKIWNKFKEATKSFNAKKNLFYKEIKKVQKDNLNLKMSLIERAESIKDSEDWETATEIMKNIQQEWKNIGHVPRKFSDDIWKKFKGACNYYFDRLHALEDEANAEKFAVYQQKKSYLSGLQAEAKNDDFSPDLKQLKTYIKEWKEIGTVPRAQRYINGNFNKFLDTYFAKLSLNKVETTMLRYKNLIDSYVEQDDSRKIDNEVQYVRKKLDTITKEKQQLENNMLFFSNTDDSNPMIKNIKKNISNYESDISILKSKLAYLRKI